VTASLDDELALDLARSVGQRLLALRAHGSGPGSDYPDADGLRKAADLMSHEFLTSELARLRPADAVLSEEGTDDRARLAARRVWIIDPLDGTREFGEAGRTDWAVHVGLWQEGTLAAGAVALPAVGQAVSTADPPQVPAGQREGQLRLLVSRSRAPAFARAVAGELDAHLIGMGSAGAKAAAVIMGEADAYVHAGGQYEWDSAAPVAVAIAAGLHASRLDGSELRYNQPDPWLPDIVICPSELADRLLSVIGRARSADGPGQRGPEPVPAHHRLPTEPEQY
jgi:3'(2'), 5'-bisphosphate nucleotidase